MSVKSFFDAIAKFIENNNKYNSKRIQSLSDEEIKQEREEVRQRYAKAKSIREADWLHAILDLFDKESSKRAWGNEKPRGPSYHREHGFYIDKDD